MNIFFSALEAITILLGVGIVGFWILARRIIPADVLKVLSGLAIEVALPALVFSNLMTNFQPEKYNDWWIYPLGWILFTLISLIFTILFVKIVPFRFKKESFMGIHYQNALFIPLAVISELYGQNSPQVTHLILFTLFFSSYFFVSYPFVWSGQEKPSWKKVFNPVFVISLAAISIKFFQLDFIVPNFVISVSSMIGKMTIPLLLLVLGGNIYIDYQNREKIFWKEIFYYLTGKNIILPIIVFIILYFTSIPDSLKLIIFLESLVPPITACPVIIDSMGGSRNYGNQMVLFSFILSIVTIPFFIWLFRLIN